MGASPRVAGASGSRTFCSRLADARRGQAPGRRAKTARGARLPPGGGTSEVEVGHGQPRATKPPKGPVDVGPRCLNKGMARHPAAVILGIAYDPTTAPVEQVGAMFDEAEAAGMTVWPERLWWLEDILRERALWSAAPEVVLSAVEDEWVGSPGFNTLVEKMSRRGLLRGGTLDAILGAMGDR